MKVITNIIITHALLLALFAGAALAFAQETVSIESENTVESSSDGTSVSSDSTVNTGNQSAEEKRAAMEQKQQEQKAAVEARKAEVQENITERQAVAEEKRTEIQANIAEHKIALQTRAQERITNLAANMSNRIDAIIARFQNIIDRMNTRIEKLAEGGVDTTDAKTALTSAQISIDAAASVIANIDIEVANAVSSEDARAGWQSVKESYTDVRGHLKTAHTELRATVTALKAAVAETQSGNGVSDAVRANLSTDTEVEAENTNN